MEQHALLHRRQWIEILDLRQRHGQAIQLLLVQACQREVRRRDTTMLRLAAMLDQRLELLGIVIRQALDGRRLEHRLLKLQPRLSSPP
ncbi:hypothetical protein [Pseudomonas chlororaphis]|uniref:hypothetical protein n=1 Tax=Pseudomonas chlororaphis TaxID=587753 RepID=UPI0024079F6A|nr:hypothetical protein [Pseudomonas chlororaphis]